MGVPRLLRTTAEWTEGLRFFAVYRVLRGDKDRMTTVRPRQTDEVTSVGATTGGLGFFRPTVRAEETSDRTTTVRARQTVDRGGARVSDGRVAYWDFLGVEI